MYLNEKEMEKYLIGSKMINDAGERGVSSYDDRRVVDRFQEDRPLFFGDW